jgi:hypothetical protein
MNVRNHRFVTLPELHRARREALWLGLQLACIFLALVLAFYPGPVEDFMYWAWIAAMAVAIANAIVAGVKLFVSWRGVP